MNLIKCRITGNPKCPLSMVEVTLGIFNAWWKLWQNIDKKGQSNFQMLINIIAWRRKVFSALVLRKQQWNSCERKLLTRWRPGVKLRRCEWKVTHDKCLCNALGNPISLKRTEASQPLHFVYHHHSTILPMFGTDMVDQWAVLF